MDHILRECIGVALDRANDIGADDVAEVLRWLRDVSPNESRRRVIARRLAELGWFLEHGRDVVASEPAMAELIEAARNTATAVDASGVDNVLSPVLFRRASELAAQDNDDLGRTGKTDARAAERDEQHG